MLRKSISTSKGFAKLSPEAAVLFCMIVPHLNSHGKSHAGTGYIKDLICPLIKYLPPERIPKCLAEISKYTKVKLFKKDGQLWIHSLSFLSKHQKLRPDRLGRDQLPTYSGLRTVGLPNSSRGRPHKEEVEVSSREVIANSGHKDWDALKANALSKIKQVTNGTT